MKAVSGPVLKRVGPLFQNRTVSRDFALDFFSGRNKNNDMNTELKKKIDEMVVALPVMKEDRGQRLMDGLFEEAKSLALTPEDKREAGRYLLEAIGRRKRSDIDVKQLMGRCLDMVNLSYISKQYFGHDKSWIYQRMNGATVNGKKAAFTQDELKKLAASLREIGLIFLDTSNSIKQSL